MKKWSLLLMALCLALLGQDRPFHYNRTESGNTLFKITAKSVENESGPIVILAGAVVTTKSLTISADEMKFNPETGEIELSGNVRARILK